MFGKPSILTRIVVAKLVGFLIGGAIFFAAPAFGIDDIKLRVGILFWYTAIGAFIAMAGVFDWHPMLKMKMPWWFMGTVIGAFMNMILVLIAWDVFAAAMGGGAFWGLTSPWWAIAEGALIGFVIAALATLFGGEGPATTRVLKHG